MRILLVNDDGFAAEGILTLARGLQKEHDCIICAPDRQRSAGSHSLTMFEPVEVEKKQIKGITCPIYSCSGTPVDCVKLALFAFYGEKNPPDLIISGINRGANLGSDCLYSGTVSAALEGLIAGVPAIAVSLGIFKEEETLHYETAWAALHRALEHPDILPNLKRSVLNINTPNLPAAEVKGHCWAPLGLVRYADTYEKDGNRYMLHTGKLRHMPCGHESDFCRHMADFVTYTFIDWDMTALELMAKSAPF